MGPYWIHRSKVITNYSIYKGIYIRWWQAKMQKFQVHKMQGFCILCSAILGFGFPLSLTSTAYVGEDSPILGTSFDSWKIWTKNMSSSRFFRKKIRTKRNRMIVTQVASQFENPQEQPCDTNRFQETDINWIGSNGWFLGQVILGWFWFSIPLPTIVFRADVSFKGSTWILEPKHKNGLMLIQSTHKIVYQQEAPIVVKQW